MSIWTDMGFDGICVDPVSAKSVSALAADLTGKQRIAIAVDAAYPGVRNSRCSGIEVMLWLRLSDKFTEPILLVGFQPAEQILKDHPEHLALLAPGNRYEQLPLSEETKNDIEDWLTKDAGLTKENIAEKYKPYLVPAFDIRGFRHRTANVYGLRVMWEALRRQKSAPQLAYPQQLAHALNDLQVQIGIQLHESKGRKDTIPQGEIPTGRMPLVKILCVDDDASMGWSAFYQHLTYGSHDSKRNEFKELSGRSKQQGQEAVPEQRLLANTVEGVLAQVQNELGRRDVLLLDLSLFPELDATVRDVDSLSGARVLAEVRKRNRSLPILMTTASNKIWSFQDVMKLGADGYWVKPGVEDGWSERDAMENLSRLRSFLSAAVREIVRVVKEVERVEQQLSAPGTSPWWSLGKWPLDYDRTADPTDVINLIRNILDQLRYHNQRFIFDARSINALQVQRSLASIAMTAGVIFETIVGTIYSVPKEEYRYKDSADLQKDRIRNNGLRHDIMEPRGKATHPQDRGELSQEDVVRQLKGLCAFVLGPEPRYVNT